MSNQINYKKFDQSTDKYILVIVHSGIKSGEFADIPRLRAFQSCLIFNLKPNT